MAMKLLQGVPNRKVVLSWGCFDLANQSFTLVINTLLFGIFVKEVILEGAGYGDFAWSLMGALSLGAVAVIGPAIGALADARRCKKKLLITTGFICAALTTALGFLPAGTAVGLAAALALAFLVYVPANIFYNIGENLMASFLPEISTRERMGRISAVGWTLGYVGALILQVIILIAIAGFGWREPAEYRPFLCFAGVWFAVMMIPTLLHLPESPGPPGGEKREAHPVAKAFRKMCKTLGEARRFPDLAALLSGFFIYGMGVQVIIFFSGIIAVDDFGFTTTYLFGYSLVVTVTAGAGAFTVGLIQDRIGHRTTVISSLVLWTLVAIGMMGLSWLRSRSGEPAAFPHWPVWIVGMGVGLGLGSIGTATRAVVGILTPAHRTAEFFGLWGTTSKLAGLIGLPIFGWIRFQFGPVPSLGVLAAFFIGGALIVWRLVDIDRGQRTATRAEL